MKSGKIAKKMVTASSVYNQRYAATEGRLNGKYSWLAKYKNSNQWFKVDLKRAMKITKIATQARSNANQWVTRYTASYSQDGLHWSTYRRNSQDKVSWL